jgi:hypothetical protein
LDGFEGSNRVHFNDVLMFKFLKICFIGKDPSEYGIRTLLPSGGIFESDVPTLPLHELNSDFANNYYLMDEESTKGMVIPSGITSSWTRNPQEECLFY